MKWQANKKNCLCYRCTVFRKEWTIKKYINIPFKSVHVLYVLLNAHIIQYQSSFYCCFVTILLHEPVDSTLEKDTIHKMCFNFCTMKHKTYRLHINGRSEVNFCPTNTFVSVVSPLLLLFDASLNRIYIYAK